MKYVIVILVLGCLYGCSRNQHPPVKTGLEGKIIPSFELLLMDSVHKFNTQQIPVGKPVVFLLFSPGCPFCRALTKDIAKNMQSLKGIQFYVISPFPFEQVKNYSEEFQLERYPNVIVAQDYTTYFQNYFKVPGVPYVAIYSKDKKLKKAFIGGIDADIIQQTAFR